MKILILGGTGFVGSKVVDALNGHEVFLFHREFSTSKCDSNVRHIIGDRQYMDQYRGCFSQLKPDVILDMIPKNGEDAQHVADCLTGISERLVAISSASVYKHFGVMIGIEKDKIDNRPITEQFPIRRRLYPYRDSSALKGDKRSSWLQDYDKIPAERVYLEHPEFQCNVVRLPMVYGPKDPDIRIEYYLKYMLDKHSVILLQESVAQWRNSRAYVENAAAAIAKVVLHGKSPIYNVSDIGDYTEFDWVKLIGELFGWKGGVSLTPDGDISGRPSVDELPMKTNFNQHLCLDSSLIRDELGYREVVSTTDAIRTTIEAFKKRLPKR